MKPLIIVIGVLVLVFMGYLMFRPHTVIAPEGTPTPSSSGTPVATPTPNPVRTATPTPTSGLNVQQVGVHDVTIQGFQFSPASVTVNQGDIIIFTNRDQVQHTVTSDTGAFIGGTVAPGSQLTVDTDTLAPGTYAYHCSIHPSMQGSIIVQ
jgi:plastocyanin